MSDVSFDGLTITFDGDADERQWTPTPSPHPELICLPDGRCYRTIDDAQLHEITVVHDGPGWLERAIAAKDDDSW